MSTHHFRSVRNRFLPILIALSIGLALVEPASALNTPCEEDPSRCKKNQISPTSIRSALLHDASISTDYLVQTRRIEGRSLPLAFGMSAILPGAGQAYNGHWTKAIIGLAIEATAIAIWASSNSRGNDAEDDFIDFAHQNWEPKKYAAWINDYSDFLEESHGANITAASVVIPARVDFQTPNSWGDADRTAALQMFAQIQTVERQLFHPETGASFSHQVPNFGDQQYYELIGKYFQFAPGWNDYPDWLDEGGNFTAAIDPELSGSGNSKPNVSTTFFKYADDHAHAQDLLRRASQISLLVVANHVIAAVDAAVSAKLHNDRISTSMGFEHSIGGDYVPVASIRYRL